jgi:hypothetical protein
LEFRLEELQNLVEGVGVLSEGWQMQTGGPSRRHQGNQERAPSPPAANTPHNEVGDDRVVLLPRRNVLGALHVAVRLRLRVRGALHSGFGVDICVYTFIYT